jgi:hypothetical protein
MYTDSFSRGEANSSLGFYKHGTGRLPVLVTTSLEARDVFLPDPNMLGELLTMLAEEARTQKVPPPDVLLESDFTVSVPNGPTFFCYFWSRSQLDPHTRRPTLYLTRVVVRLAPASTSPRTRLTADIDLVETCEALVRPEAEALVAELLAKQSGPMQ